MVKKILVATCFLLYEFAISMTKEDVKNKFKDDTSEAIKRYINTTMYNEQTSQMKKLYKNDVTTLSEKALNESLYSATTLVKKWHDKKHKFNKNGTQSGYSFLSKAWQDTEIYNYENISQLNGLVYIECFEKGILNNTNINNDNLKREVANLVQEKLEYWTDHDYENIILKYIKAIPQNSSKIIEKHEELSEFYSDNILPLIKEQEATLQKIKTISEKITNSMAPKIKVVPDIIEIARKIIDSLNQLIEDPNVEQHKRQCISNTMSTFFEGYEYELNSTTNKIKFKGINEILTETPSKIEALKNKLTAITEKIKEIKNDDKSIKETILGHFSTCKTILKNYHFALMHLYLLEHLLPNYNKIDEIIPYDDYWFPKMTTEVLYNYFKLRRPNQKEYERKCKIYDEICNTEKITDRLEKAEKNIEEYFNICQTISSEGNKSIQLINDTICYMAKTYDSLSGLKSKLDSYIKKSSTFKESINIEIGNPEEFLKQADSMLKALELSKTLQQAIFTSNSKTYIANNLSICFNTLSSIVENIPKNSKKNLLIKLKKNSGLSKIKENIKDRREKKKAIAEAIKKCGFVYEPSKETLEFLNKNKIALKEKNIYYNVALLTINDVFWYLKNFKAASLYNDLKNESNKPIAKSAPENQKPKQIENSFSNKPNAKKETYEPEKKNNAPHNQSKEVEKIDEKPINKFKTVGLTNLNNTCYFNTAMQALCASPKFKKFVKKNLKKIDFAETLDDLFTKMETSTTTLTREQMRIFFDKIAGIFEGSYYTKDGELQYRRLFLEEERNDSTELILHILNKLNEELKRKDKLKNNLWTVSIKETQKPNTQNGISTKTHKKEEITNIVSSSFLDVALNDSSSPLNLKDIIDNLLKSEETKRRFLPDDEFDKQKMLTVKQYLLENQATIAKYKDFNKLSEANKTKLIKEVINYNYKKENDSEYTNIQKKINELSEKFSESTIKTKEFSELPMMLCIRLRRDSIDKKGNIKVIKTPVSYPKKLALKKVLGSKKNKTVNYKLVAVINYTGSHYFAYVRGQDETWHKQNDATTTTIETKVLDSPSTEVLALIYEQVD